MPSPFLHPLKKGFLFPLSLGKKRIYLDTHLEEEFTDLYWKQGVPIPQAEHKEDDELFYNG